jgi:hypothetical protein
MTQPKARRDLALHFVLPMVAVGLLAFAVGSLPWKLGPSWFGGERTLEDRLKMLGTFGDMFGFLNAVFSGVAFAAIYYTLRIQQKQHDIQAAELNMKKEIAQLTIDQAESRETFPTTVPGNQQKQCPASYVRLVLKNEARMPAKGCRVLLTAIEKKKPGEGFAVEKRSKLTLRLVQPTEENDPPEDRTFTIPHGLPHYFNVCSIKRDPPDGHAFGLIQVAHHQSKYENLTKVFELGCDYRFHISVDAENSTPLAVQMVVSVGTDPDKLQVNDIKVEEKRGLIVYAT